MIPHLRSNVLAILGMLPHLPILGTRYSHLLIYLTLQVREACELSVWVLLTIELRSEGEIGSPRTKLLTIGLVGG